MCRNVNGRDRAFHKCTRHKVHVLTCCTRNSLHKRICSTKLIISLRSVRYKRGEYRTQKPVWARLNQFFTHTHTHTGIYWSIFNVNRTQHTILTYPHIHIFTLTIPLSLRTACPQTMRLARTCPAYGLRPMTSHTETTRERRSKRDIFQKLPSVECPVPLLHIDDIIIYWINMLRTLRSLPVLVRALLSSSCMCVCVCACRALINDLYRHSWMDLAGIFVRNGQPFTMLCAFNAVSFGCCR